MSFLSGSLPVQPDRESRWSHYRPRLAAQFRDAGNFLHGLRVQLRFGELTRAPLSMLRFQMLEDVAECDWLARPADPWDRFLRNDAARRHASLQALRDAIDVRHLLFYTLPAVHTAHFRIYRESAQQKREMIIRGEVERSGSAFRDVRSLAMRANLLGFRFSLRDGVLHGLNSDERVRKGA